jgi:hypothetical protein
MSCPPLGTYQSHPSYSQTCTQSPLLRHFPSLCSGSPSGSHAHSPRLLLSPPLSLTLTLTHPHPSQASGRTPKKPGWGLIRMKLGRDEVLDSYRLLFGVSGLSRCTGLHPSYRTASTGALHSGRLFLLFLHAMEACGRERAPALCFSCRFRCTRISHVVVLTDL